VNILLVDANISGPDILATVQPDLKGSQIITCFSGRSALDIINHGFSPDIAIIDTELPDMSALTLMDMLRLQMNHVYTLLLLPRDESANFADNAGADDFLFKPVDNRDLSFKLKKALREKGWTGRQRREPVKDQVKKQDAGEREEALITNYFAADNLPTEPDRFNQGLLTDNQADQTDRETSFTEQIRISFNQSDEAEQPQSLPELTDLPPDQPVVIYTYKEHLEIEPPPIRQEGQPGIKDEYGRQNITVHNLNGEGAETEVEPVKAEECVAQPGPILPGKSKQPRKNKVKRVYIGRSLKTAGELLAIALLLFMSALTIFLILNRIGHGVVAVSGYRFLLASGIGADPVIQPGSLLVAGKPDLEEIAPGDLITTGSVQRNNLLFHRVSGIKTDRDAVLTSDRDPERAGESNLLAAADITGKIYYSLPVVGRILAYVQTLGGLISFIIVPGLLIMFHEVSAIHKIFFRKSNTKELIDLKVIIKILVFTLAALNISAAFMVWLSS